MLRRLPFAIGCRAWIFSRPFSVGTEVSSGTAGRAGSVGTMAPAGSLTGNTIVSNNISETGSIAGNTVGTGSMARIGTFSGTGSSTGIENFTGTNWISESGTPTGIGSLANLVESENSSESPTESDTGSDINFRDHRAVQQSKTRAELIRALAVLRLCSIDLFVSRSLLWMRMGRRLLGQGCFNALMRRSFFGQFVGGETEAELRLTAEVQRRQGLRPMIAVPIEEPVGKVLDEELTRLYEANTNKQVRAVELSAELSSSRPKMQLKLTSLMPTPVLLALASHQQPDAADAASTALAELLLMPDSDIRNSSTAERQLVLLGRLLPASAEQHFDQLLAGVRRVRRVFDTAKRHSVQILIDAEYSHINAGISLFYLALATVYNAGDRCLVFNTYQCYLRDTPTVYQWQTELLLSASGRGVRAGAKIVRGAYLDWENGRGAQLNGGQTRVWGSHAETNAAYNRVVANALDRIATDGGNSSRHEMILATHNADSINLCLDGIRRRGIATDSGVVSFGQLYGMADYVSIPLSRAGCQVYKSIPYGSVDETLLYLVRRASENKLIFGGVREERNVLRAALWNRKQS